MSTYRHTDEYPDNVIVILETDNRTQRTEHPVPESDWKMGRYVANIHVFPGVQYWITVRAENQDGVEESNITSMSAAAGVCVCVCVCAVGSGALVLVLHNYALKDVLYAIARACNSN